MRHKLKRIMAAMLAVLSVFASVYGYAPQTFAEDSSKLKVWNATTKAHAKVSQFSSNYTGQILFSVIDGQVAYCMNFGLGAQNGMSLDRSDTPAKTTMSDEQVKLLTFCMYYGYGRDGEDAPDNDSRDRYIATQANVWIIENGIFGTDDANAAASTLTAAAPNPTTSYSYYETLRDQISNAMDQTIPSFTDRMIGHASTYELKWNEANMRFETTLTDENNSLEGYDLSLDGYTVSREGNTLTISSAEVQTSSTAATLTSNLGKVETTSNCLYWIDDNASNQDFVSGKPTADPLKAYFKVKTEDIGYGYLEKSDSLTGTMLANAVYGIYSDSACTSLVERMVTNSEGKCKSGALTAGTYYVKEITAPNGYVIDTEVHTLVVKAGQTTTFSATDDETFGSLTIYKQGEVLTGWNGTDFVYESRYLPGAEFQVTAGADIYRADGKKAYSKGDVIAENLKTDSDGKAVLEHLHLGTYTVTETRSINGYTINGTAQTVVLTYHDQTAEMEYEDTTIWNDRQKAAVTVVKQDKDTQNPLAGGEFTLYADNDIRNYERTVIMTKGTKIQTITTGADGKAVYTVDLPIENSYSVKETKAPTGYVRNTSDTYTFAFHGAEESIKIVDFSHTFVNDRVRAKIHLYKVDSDTGEPVAQGDASLTGAVYGLYARKDIVHPDGRTGVLYPKNTLIAELTINDLAEAEIEDLYLGEYYVKELVAPTGYNLDTKEHDVVCSYEGDQVAEVSRTVTSKEDVKKQAFQLIKVSEDSKETEADLLSGVEFQAYLTSKLPVKEDGNYDFESAKPVVIGDNGATTITTDNRGYAVSIPIPYGTYVVVESKTPHNLETIQPFEVVIREHKPTEPQVWRVFLDREFEAKLRIVKQDGETQKTILVPGAEFKIYNLDTRKYVSMITSYPSKVTHTTFVTDEDGDLILPETLAVGRYRIEEVAAPYGYVKNDSYVEVVIDSDTFYETDLDTYEAVITVTYVDDSVTGSIKVYKSGEVLTDYAGGLFADSEDKQFVYEERGLAGAEYAIYAAEDIYTADHQTDAEGSRIKEYQKDELVAALITGEDGYAQIDDLPLGSYRVVEVKAPYGYLLNSEEQIVTLEYQDDVTPVIFDSIAFQNDRETVSLTVKKVDAEDGRRLKGAVFGLYAGEDILSVDGTVIVTEGELIETAASDELGSIHFVKDLPFAIYHAKELQAPDGYVSSDEVILFHADYVDEQTPVAAYHAEFVNQPTEFDFSKQDITSGEELSGATLSVFSQNGELVETWTSQAGVTHKIKRLHVGETYILREEFAPYGYLRATDVEFTVEDTAAIQSVVMKDDVPTGTIIINKDGELLQDKAEQKWYETIFLWRKKALAGITFDVYAADDILGSDESKLVYYAKDERIGEIVTNEQGIASIDGLPLGSYYLVETSTLEGFVLDPTPIMVTLSYVDQDTPVVYAGDHVFNERQRVSVMVVKKDSETGEPLEGAAFGLFVKQDLVNEDGEIVLAANEMVEKAVTNVDGKIHFLSDLPLGQYYVKELQAPKGYATSDEVFYVDADYQGDTTDVIEVAAECLNTPIRVEFSKTDITGDHELAGATLMLLDEDGNLIDQWISEKEPHLVEMIPTGNYILREYTSPYGYKIANNLAFTVSDTAEIQKVQMKDDYLYGKIALIKHDAISDKKLDGVEFEIRDSDGNVLETLVTDKNGYAESKELPICTYTENGIFDKHITYYLVETKAKEGYVLNDTPYEVVLSYEGAAPEIVTYMLDIPNDKIPDIPKTGDGFRPVLAILAGVLSLFAFVWFIAARKKNKK